MSDHPFRFGALNHAPTLLYRNRGTGEFVVYHLVDTFADLAGVTGKIAGKDLAWAADTKLIYVWDGAAWTAPTATPTGAAGGMLTGTYPNPTLNMSPITAALAGDVALNDIALYFDGPSIAQGTSGTWFVSGSVTVQDNTAGNNVFGVKLWDGTTVIASASPIVVGGAINRQVITLSGFIVAPAANLRLSVIDFTTVAGLIKFNASGLSKDSIITAIRIA